MSVLDPISHVLATAVATAHSALTSLGADPESGSTWVLCIATVVVLVRVALLPLAIHGVRQAHAIARARPHLTELTDRYRKRNRKDPDSVRAFLAERRRISAEHKVSRWGVLPLLVQLPIWLALYHLLVDLAAGMPVGAVNLALTASLGAATVLGVPLAERGYLGGSWTHLAAVAALAGTAALLSYVTQRFLVLPNMVLTDVPDVMVRVQQVLPALSAVGLLVAGGFVPVALLVYWVCNAGWTLAQSAVVSRWFPTPGSPAATRPATA